MKKMKAVIFDMDGVIFDTEKLVLSSWKQVAGRRGVEGIEEVFLECVGTNTASTIQTVQKHYGSDFPFDDFRKEATGIFQATVKKNGMPVKPGVEELLSYLKNSGFKIGLASSTRRAIVEEELEMAGFLPYFEIVMGGDMIKNSKPDPEIFLTCCEKLGCKPEETIVIEDSHNGIRAASRAGMTSFMVPDLLPVTEEMENLSDRIFWNLSEVRDYLENNEI